MAVLDHLDELADQIVHLSAVQLQVIQKVSVHAHHLFYLYFMVRMFQHGCDGGQEQLRLSRVTRLRQLRVNLTDRERKWPWLHDRLGIQRRQYLGEESIPLRSGLHAHLELSVDSTHQQRVKQINFPVGEYPLPQFLQLQIVLHYTKPAD